MSWRDEKADRLQKSRDFSFLQDDEGDRSQREVQRSRPAKASEDRANQEKLLRLKALEKQRADKQKKQHYVESSSPEAQAERRVTERSAGVSGSKRGGTSGNDKFGSFFGKVERVVAKRVIDEQREREIAARERRLAEAEKARARPESSRNGSDAKHQSTRPGSSSGSRPVAKPKPQNLVAVKAQKLKDNRDYSFLFSDEPASKPPATEARAQPSKEPRPTADSAARQKLSQKPRPASNGAARLAAGQGPSSAQGRKAGASRPVSAGERDSNARDPRAHESERRFEKELRHARAERDPRAERDGRFESERRVEAGRGAGPSRVALAGKSASKGAPAKSPAAPDRDRRATQERPPSAARPKPTNHDRPVARVPSTMKSSSLSRLSEGTGQRMSQSGPAISRERVVQKSMTVSQSVQRNDLSAMKRKMGGEPIRKPAIVAKANDGRRVDRSRYGGSDSESEMMRRLVAGGPSPPQPARATILSKPIAGAAPMRRVSEEPARRKTMDAPLRRRAEEEPARKRSGDEVMRSRPAVTKDRKRPRHSDSESESESDDGRRPRKSGVSSIIQKLFRYNPNKYADLDDEDDRNMETSFKHIQAEERRSARLAREEDEREQELIEAEERAERERKLRRQKMMK